MLDLAIHAVGMACAVGLTAASACAAIRGHVNRFEETSFRDPDGNAVYAATVQELADGRTGHGRLRPLLQQALADCSEQVGLSCRDALRRHPLFVMIDAGARPDHPEHLARDLGDELAREAGGRLNAASRVVAAGQAGFVSALMAAEKLVDRHGQCFIVGVDSFVNRKMLRHLGARRLLKTDTDSDGLIPGEAAAAVCLRRTSPSAPALAHLRGAGVSPMSSLQDGRQLQLGREQAQAIRIALQHAGMPLHAMDFRVAGVTGLRREFMESSNALARVQHVHKDNFEMWCPCEQLGAVGAATPVCLLVVAATAVSAGYAPGPNALVFSADVQSSRVACVLTSSPS